MTAFDGVLIGAVIACLICTIQIFPSGGDGKKRAFFVAGLCILLVAITIICAAAYKFQWESQILEIPSEAPHDPAETTEAPGLPTETTVPEATVIPPDVQVGDTITLGTWEQDNTTRKSEEIEWIVLAKEENEILLLSLRGLDSQPFNKTYKAVTWETSTIRQWLNEGFYNKAFTPDERELILLSELQPGNCPAKDCDRGMDTEDYVFLLSLDEVKIYIKENGLIDSDALLCRPTEYAHKIADAYKNEKGYGWWWLRTSTNNNCYACSVNSDGSIDTTNGKVNSPKAVVRPAMWIICE